MLYMQWVIVLLCLKARGVGYLQSFFILCMVAVCFACAPAFAVQQRITMQNSVELTPAEQLFIASLPPLKVAAYPITLPYDLSQLQVG